ncbi:hypothetical protein FC56_GL001125 [Lentilactobacillus senioris DSM 24302 = JCM 17472]|uniref:Lipoprotein n=1 Tax=Lentilactobacillus senioris DSM 24302 = JCM 17472 TaxID=1423802 RepID=A0A0R2CQR7_9LACO|nr:hypothetical protein [Lentilactobacillus senioris]KRM94177.1 hypothetical protein FC56_GL001125 [Lentilactobacillus senioris DSM 24302 = JCM 17472]
MKKAIRILTAVGAAFALALVLVGCGNSKSQSNGSNDSSKASMQNTNTNNTDAKTALTSGGKLWYMAGSLNAKSKSGFDAYYFKGNKVTIYGVDKIYKSFDAAKKANALDKQGTLTYSFKNKSKTRPVISMKGQLSGLDMEQTISVKKPVSGTNKASGLKVSGYKVVRDLDYDKTNQVLVAVQ